MTLCYCFLQHYNPITANMPPEDRTCTKVSTAKLQSISLCSRNSKLCKRMKILFFSPSEIIFRNCLIIKAPQKEQGIAVREALLLKGCPSFQESECLCTYLVLPLSYCTNAHESFPFFRPIFFCL